MAVNGVSQRSVQSAPQSPPATRSDQVSQHTLLKSGSRGPEVSDLQQRLSKAGFQTGQGGVFDQKTEQAVRQYQQAQGLLVDGKVGQQTWGSFFGQKLPPGTQMLRQPANPDPTGRNKDSFEPAGQGPSANPGTGSAQGPASAGPANGSTVDKMLAEARSQVGYREGAGNSNKFSTAMGRPAEAWCADFVSYVARQGGAKTVNTASAQGIADQLAKQGRWKGRNNPQPGDAVTFNWSGSGGWANHVGLVDSVYRQNGQTYIRTIEGNSSDGVRYRTYPANSRVINGFGTIA